MNLSKAKLWEIMHESFILGKNDGWELNLKQLYENYTKK